MDYSAEGVLSETEDVCEDLAAVEAAEVERNSRREQQRLQQLRQDEERQVRHDRLMRLLTKSEFYSDFLSKKINKCSPVKSKNAKENSKEQSAEEVEAKTGKLSQISKAEGSEKENTHNKTVRKTRSANSKENIEELSAGEIEIKKDENLSQKSNPEVSDKKNNQNKTLRRTRSTNSAENKEQNAGKSEYKKQDKKLEAEGSDKENNQDSTLKRTKSTTGKKRKNEFTDNKIIEDSPQPKSKKAKMQEPEDTENEFSPQTPQLLSGVTLRPHQIEGFQWLKTMYENGVNGMLADEMGLGKTAQSLCMIAHLVEMGVPGPFLVVAPLSTLHNWCREARVCTPQLPCVLFHGDAATRKSLLPSLTKPLPVTVTSAEGGTVTRKVCPIVVTSYEMVTSSVRDLGKLWWRYLIVDEGHRLKNHSCRLVASLARYTRVTYRLLLTGTPLHNCLAELWSLLHFLIPEVFDSLDVFESWFDASQLSEADGGEKMLQHKEVITTLHKILSPFLLRRTKVDVESVLQLPPKSERLVYATMTGEQHRLYTATVNRDHAALTQGGDGFVQRRVRMQNIVMQCRRIVNHPYLVEWPMQVDEGVVTSCGKLQLLDQLLHRLHSTGHKVLLFSQMTKLLDVMEDYLSLRPQYQYRRLDGSVSVTERQEDIEAFNSDPNIFLFLLSTRAGSLGINLTAADTVILYDSDWNPQCDLQAMDRCHRMGQTRPVLVIRLITRHTVEERMVSLADGKRCLEKIIIRNGHFRDADLNNRAQAAAMDSKELLELLQQQQKSILTSDNTTANSLTAEELYTLLDRNIKQSIKASPDNSTK